MNFLHEVDFCDVYYFVEMYYLNSHNDFFEIGLKFFFLFTNNRYI